MSEPQLVAPGGMGRRWGAPTGCQCGARGRGRAGSLPGCHGWHRRSSQAGTCHTACPLCGPGSPGVGGRGRRWHGEGVPTMPPMLSPCQRWAHLALARLRMALVGVPMALAALTGAQVEPAGAAGVAHVAVLRGQGRVSATSCIPRAMGTAGGSPGRRGRGSRGGRHSPPPPAPVPGRWHGARPRPSGHQRACMARQDVQDVPTALPACPLSPASTTPPRYLLSIGWSV